MLVSDLTLDQLDFWVAKAKGIHAFIPANQRELHYVPAAGVAPRRWNPSRFWSQGGPLIEESHIDLNWDTEGTKEWSASLDPDILMFGATPLEAAMRAFVASRLGHELPG